MDCRTKILFLASNPKRTKRLALDEEARSISEGIEKAEYRDLLDFVTSWATRSTDLLNNLMKFKPVIVHFSGHGSGKEGLVFMDDQRKCQLVSTEVLSELFSVVKDNIRLVVLNACLTKEQGLAISEIIECVVGMNNEFSDDAAISFAAQFYSAIAYGRSVKEAFEQGKLSINLEGIPEENIPELLCRRDVDPAKVFLVSTSPPMHEGDKVYFKKLENREAMYKKAKEMISESKSLILDTTWGISPPPTTDAEKIARQDYRNEADKAVIRGIQYKDLFSTAKRQIDELKKVTKKNKKYKNYEGKYLDLIDENLPVIDLLIVDDEEILLSNVSYSQVISVSKFLYLESKEIADFYTAYFNECWNKAKAIL